MIIKNKSGEVLKEISGADLSGADLSRANLSRADLSRADLSGANLSGANLSEANLSEANLYGANLSEADLSGANLYGADLSGTKIENITGFWDSHTIISEILKREAKDSVERRKIAGLILISIDWYWKKFLSINDPEKEWALNVLREFGKNDPSIPYFFEGDL